MIVCVTEALQDLLEARVCNVHWASSRPLVALRHVLNALPGHPFHRMRRLMAIIAKHVWKILLLLKKMALCQLVLVIADLYAEMALALHVQRAFTVRSNTQSTHVLYTRFQTLERGS